MPTWTEAERAALRRLWQVRPVLSAAAIGRDPRINKSKNAVCGEAHRMNLDPRPSPIRGGPRSGPLPPPKVTPAHKPKVTLPSLISAGAPSPQPSRQPIVAPPPKAPPPGAASVRPAPTHPCAWPIGEPGSKGFRYCEAPAELGQSYCLDHCKLAYPNWKGRAAA